MNMTPELKAFVDEHGLVMRRDMWDCHGTPVILHKALERIAAQKGITFDKPEVYQADGEKKIVSVMVNGKLGDAEAWSIGEAAPYNNKNGYPWAMAEKRAKDRVILKLLNISGEVYSEDEADDFKSARPAVDAPAEPEAIKRQSSAEAKRNGDWEMFMGTLEKCTTLAKLNDVEQRAEQNLFPTWKDGWIEAGREEIGKVRDFLKGKERVFEAAE